MWPYTPNRTPAAVAVQADAWVVATALSPLPPAAGVRSRQGMGDLSGGRLTEKTGAAPRWAGRSGGGVAGLAVAAAGRGAYALAVTDSGAVAQPPTGDTPPSTPPAGDALSDSPGGEAPGAVALHGPEDPVVAGNVWTGPALSEQPGSVTPAPRRWTNPAAHELHGSSTPAESPVWTPSHGGATGPYDLGRTETAPPAGYTNPPARELHGSVLPPT
jgi:hypothetical protein